MSGSGEKESDSRSFSMKQLHGIKNVGIVDRLPREKTASAWKRVLLAVGEGVLMEFALERPSAQYTLQRAQKSGYGHKKGHLRKNWTRRLLVLCKNVLFYYRTVDDASPQGLIFLPLNIEFNELKDEFVPKGCSCGFSFEANHPKNKTKHWEFAFDTAEEMECWKEEFLLSTQKFERFVGFEDYQLDMWEPEEWGADIVVPIKGARVFEWNASSGGRTSPHERGLEVLPNVFALEEHSSSESHSHPPAGLRPHPMGRFIYSVPFESAAISVWIRKIQEQISAANEDGAQVHDTRDRCGSLASLESGSSQHDPD